MLYLHIISYIVAKMVLSWDKTLAICTDRFFPFSKMTFPWSFFFGFTLCFEVAAKFAQS